ncbi:hypothetical protein TR51_21705 [Kitasatospora griseola]|uniref:Uncharacterized protein n=1 Tax=Kitasatospora griseola TaxID=2064 RepID=A0A0D0NRW3_KITGR|nr:hypothetical protein TR51_21705 [Kitasatospora griseola]
MNGTGRSSSSASSTTQRAGRRHLPAPVSGACATRDSRSPPRPPTLCHAEDKLRYLLASAGEPTSIDQAALPALAKYAADHRIDGPTAVTRIRNRLVHPEILADDLYAHGGLATEVWRLSLHYATLMILHQIGYHGSYQRQVQLDRWAGDTQPMPWVDPATAPTTPVPLPPVRRQRPPRRRR